MSGLFISVEGNDGSGKSTQTELLKKYFEEKKYHVVFVREPGGTSIGEKIREIITDPQNSGMKSNAELLLYAAARAQLAGEVIIPELKNGAVVISDRFVDSSIVYQGYGRGLDIESIININKFATMGIVPDLTFVLALEPEKGLARKKNQQKLDRIESENMAFHRRIYTGYLNLSQRYPDRIVMIDAEKSIEEIHNDMVAEIKKLMEERGI